MPELIDHVAYLSREIGPRLAGTEEEQQAALYITEQIQKEAGLSAVIEDFDSASDGNTSRIICYFCALAGALLSLFVPLSGVVSVVITTVAALLFAAEAFGRPILSKMFHRGVSQNVVAKYEPNYSPETGSRRRKVVVVSRYDSGKVRAELREPFIRVLPLFQQVSLGVMIALPILLLLRNVVFLSASKATITVFNVFIVVVLSFIAIAFVASLIHKWAPYNEGANCNAAGTAVLLEVARRIGRGQIGEAEFIKNNETTVHGESAARAAGLAPEGAELVYEIPEITPPQITPQSPEERLLSAKAAIAAMTGKAISGINPSDISHNLVQIKEHTSSQSSDSTYSLIGDERSTTPVKPDEDMSTVSASALSATAQDVHLCTATDRVLTSDISGMLDATNQNVFQQEDNEAMSSDVPDWFRKAQEKAKKSRVVEKPIQRSRYASVLDVAKNSDRFTQEIAAVQAAAESDELQQPFGETSSYKSLNSASTSASGIDSALVIDSMGSASVVSASEQNPNEVFSEEKSVVCSCSDIQSAAVLRQENASSDTDTDVFNEGAFDEVRDDITCDKVAVVSDDVRIQKSELNNHMPRRAVFLPDIDAPSVKQPSITEAPKQRAPLADIESAGKVAAKKLLNMLPSIDIESSKNVSLTDTAPSVSEDVQKTRMQSRLTLPSLSGDFSPLDTVPEKHSNINAAGAFMSISATSAFAPVSDELLENVDPEDIYIDDVDDSVYETNTTQTGAFVGSGYVDMPQSRIQRLLSRFHRKKKIEDIGTREWLNVNETFDARTVGARRGSWESFRQDESFDNQENVQNDIQDDTEYSDSFYDSGNQDYDTDQFEDDETDFNSEDSFDFGDFSAPDRRPWNGGAFSSSRAESVLREDSQKAAFSAASQEDISDELQQIYRFRDSGINTEVWFVFLGSELAQNSGMSVFLAEHQQDLRGAVIIELDALGAGDLSVIEREGMYAPVKTSSRMKRYVKKASQATGISVKEAQLLWENSSTSFALKHGYQALHLAGIASDKPAYFAQNDDVVENVEEDKLVKHADFVMELLKNI